jgi:hypothetical protein
LAWMQLRIVLEDDFYLIVFPFQKQDVATIIHYVKKFFAIAFRIF